MMASRYKNKLGCYHWQPEVEIKMDAHYQNMSFKQLVSTIEILEKREFRVFQADDAVYAIEGGVLYRAEHGEILECIGSAEVGAPTGTPDYVMDALYGRAT